MHHYTKCASFLTLHRQGVRKRGCACLRANCVKSVCLAGNSILKPTSLDFPSAHSEPCNKVCAFKAATDILLCEFCTFQKRLTVKFSQNSTSNHFTNLIAQKKIIVQYSISLASSSEPFLPDISDLST